MKTGKQISIGLKGYSKAWNLIFKRGFAKYLLFPLILNIVIFWIGTDYISDLAVTARDALKEWMDIHEGDFWGAKFLNSFVSGLVTVLMYVMFFIVFVYTGGYIIIILLSPVFSIISEKTEHLISHNKNNYPFELKQFLKDIIRGITLAIRNMLYETFIMIVVFIISFIPVIGWLGPIFMFFISAYFFGFSYMDLTNERKRRSIRESVRFIRKYKWVAITNGAVFSIALVIPYCGVAVSAFIAVISIIAGTVSMIEIHKYEDELKILN